MRSEEHTSELQSRQYLVCRLQLEKKNIRKAARDFTGWTYKERKPAFNPALHDASDQTVLRSFPTRRSSDLPLLVKRLVLGARIPLFSAIQGHVVPISELVQSLFFPCAS